MSDEECPPDDGPGEALKVFDWRVLQALDVGCTPEEAAEFAAGDGDVGRLRALVQNGWPGPLAARTV